jgi:hypothetical protein
MLKLKFGKKGISTFIAVLLMMVLAVSAGVVIYAYTMGYLGSFGAPTQNRAAQIQSIAVVGDEVWVYLKNTGTGSIPIESPNSNIRAYVNDVPVTLPQTGFTDPSTPTLDEGDTVKIKLPMASFNDGQTNKIKIVTVDGVFAETQQKVDSGTQGTPGQYSVTFQSGVGGSVSPTGTQQYGPGASVSISATPDASHDFSQWTTDNPTQILIAAPSSLSTTATINGAGTITATFNLKGGIILTITKDGTGTGAVTPDKDPPYTYGDVVQLTPTADASSDFAGWAAGSAGSGTTVRTVTMNGDQSVTATFNLKTFTITVTQGSNGVIAPGTTAVSYGGGQDFTVTPSLGYHIESITTDSGPVTVTSPSGQTVSFTNVQADHSLTATYTQNPNQAPVLATIGNKNVNELDTLAFTASATDADIPAQTLTFSLDAGYPTGASINPSTGAFTWIPTEDQGPGSYPITVRVTDNGSPVQDDHETITVTVNEVNVAPVLTTITDKTVDELVQLAFTATATDSDLPAQALTFNLQGTNNGASITSGGAFTWTPTEAQGPGDYSFTVRVTDSGGLYNEKGFSVHVNEVTTTTTLLTDGFEVNLNNWASTNWDQDSSQHHSGSYSVNSDYNNIGSLTSNNLDTSGATSITIDFYYRLSNTEDTDLVLYYYDGSTYDFIVNLGGGSEGTWLHYTQTITDSQYFKTNFQIRFTSNVSYSLFSPENVYIDDVLIQKIS